MKLYVGNLPWSIDDSGLKELFSSYSVEEANLIKDKYSGRSKGFGFVTIEDVESAKKAIEIEIDHRLIFKCAHVLNFWFRSLILLS